MTESPAPPTAKAVGICLKFDPDDHALAAIRAGSERFGTMKAFIAHAVLLVAADHQRGPRPCVTPPDRFEPYVGTAALAHAMGVSYRYLLRVKRAMGIKSRYLQRSAVEAWLNAPPGFPETDVPTATGEIGQSDPLRGPGLPA